MSELKVDAVAEFLALNTCTFISRAIFQDQLLEEEERPLVVDLLSYLHLRLPEMWSVDTLAIVALQILNPKINDESLLHFGAT